MKIIINLLFTIFFAIAIYVHIHSLQVGDDKPVWTHILYIITYGVCWWMLFSGNSSRAIIYAISAIFPFVMHLILGFQHFSAMDELFKTCVLVCIMMPAGYLFIQWKEKQQSYYL